MSPRVVSLTPAVFHLPPEVNAVSREYGAHPIVPRGPKFAPLLEDVRREIVKQLDCPSFRPILLTGTGSSAMAAVLGSCLAPAERMPTIPAGG